MEVLFFLISLTIMYAVHTLDWTTEKINKLQIQKTDIQSACRGHSAYRFIHTGIHKEPMPV